MKKIIIFGLVVFVLTDVASAAERYAGLLNFNGGNEYAGTINSDDNKYAGLIGENGGKSYTGSLDMHGGKASLGSVKNLKKDTRMLRINQLQAAREKVSRDFVNDIILLGQLNTKITEEQEKLDKISSETAPIAGGSSGNILELLGLTQNAKTTSGIDSGYVQPVYGIIEYQDKDSSYHPGYGYRLSDNDEGGRSYSGKVKNTAGGRSYN